MSKLTKKVLEQLLKDGLYNEQIADKENVHPSTVTRALKKYGLTPNPRPSKKREKKLRAENTTKKGIESRRDDRIIINWTNRTIITDDQVIAITDI